MTGAGSLAATRARIRFALTHARGTRRVSNEPAGRLPLFHQASVLRAVRAHGIRPKCRRLNDKALSRESHEENWLGVRDDLRSWLIRAA